MPSWRHHPKIFLAIGPAKFRCPYSQDDPNNLKFTELNNPTKILTRASSAVSNLSLKSSRVAAGHPEGFFEAFANIYSEFADSICNKSIRKNKNNI